MATATPSSDPLDLPFEGMRRSPTRAGSVTRRLPALVVGSALALLPSFTIDALAHRHAHFTAQVHFSGVGLTALAAALAALALTVAGARRRDRRTVLVGTAFSAMAALLALHGIATPGILVGMNGVVAFTGGATLPVGAAVLALAALPAVRRTRNVRPLIALQIVLLSAILTLGVVGMLVPSAVPNVPATRSTEAYVVLAVGLSLFALLTLRALRTFLLTRRRADLVVAIGIFWLASALPPAMLLTYMELGWWLGHGFELLGMTIVGIPVALDLRRKAQSRPLVGDVTGADLVAAEEAFLGAHVRALTLSSPDKDEYTEEHTRRVALRAVQVGEELGLTGSRLRALATGALVHDIGKLSVPDSHPPEARPSDRRGVRDHQAPSRVGRQDPRRPRVRRRRQTPRTRPSRAARRLGLSARDRRARSISFDARILGVCDVYDALDLAACLQGSLAARKGAGAAP